MLLQVVILQIINLILITYFKANFNFILFHLQFLKEVMLSIITVLLHLVKQEEFEFTNDATKATTSERVHKIKGTTKFAKQVDYI